MNYPLNIFSIDPGPKESTFVRCTFTGETSLMGQPLVISGVGSIDNEAMLLKLNDCFGATIVCEEMKFYGKDMNAGASCFDTARWSGRFEQKCAERGLKMEFMARATIKSFVAYSVRANDSAVRAALIGRYGEPGKRSAPGVLYGIAGHAWAALAVGVAWMEQLKEREGQSARLNTIHRPDSVLLSRPSCEAVAGGKNL